ncbi:hypothetical protein TWF696_002751 [Orbilia brochopaga]|uniref:Centrosomin N-terminal motif 1 domain-containing protein n=1 Tax=Orbilia brochopaga TaxID=3140254 RepID=A0AAV9U3W3_9PEZI
MGLRELENYTSSLRKENFGLKLELFHRREKDARRYAPADGTISQIEEARKLRKLLRETQQTIEEQGQSLNEAHQKISALDRQVLDLRTHLQNCQCQTKTFENGYTDQKKAEMDLNEPHLRPSNIYQNVRSNFLNGQYDEMNYPPTDVPASSSVHQDLQADDDDDDDASPTSDTIT